MTAAAGSADPETAAALRLYAALLDGADAALPEDVRRVVVALGRARRRRARRGGGRR